MGHLNALLEKEKTEQASLKSALQRTKQWQFDTIATHGIYTLEEALENNQGSMIEPTYLSSAQVFRNADELEAAATYAIPRWAYTRIHNPTLHYLENTLALLEAYQTKETASAFTASSGMAGITATIDALLARDHTQQKAPLNFISSSNVYGGTFQQFSVRQPEKGIEVRWVSPAAKKDDWEEKINAHTRFLYAEVPSNPSLSVVDVPMLATLAEKHNIPLIIDSTLASPALLRPLGLGADIVIHSLSKTITQSGLSIGGAVIARHQMRGHFLSDAQRENFALHLKLLENRDNGPCLSPLQATLTLSELRNIRLRMDHLSRSTQQVAEFLEQHPCVEKVAYPGLPSHPQHALAKTMLTLADAEIDSNYRSKQPRFGHLLSFCVKGGHEAARTCLDGFRLIYRAMDLGRIKSVANIPAISTHQQQGKQGRAIADIPNNLIRLAVGGESVEDIIRDLDTALKGLGSPHD